MIEIAVVAARVAVGTFFAISGYHKAFHKGRRETLRKTLVEDKVPFPNLSMFCIPAVELAGGVALAVGFMTPLAALALLGICGGALLFDGLKRIPTMKPLNAADYVDDVLYLPETLLTFLLIAVLAGAFPAAASIDAILLSLL